MFGSAGAKYVNSLANKLSIAMFAPSRPFFKIVIPAETRAMLMAPPHNIDDTKIDVLLSLTAKKGMQKIEQAGIRPAIIRAMKLLIVTGNTCLYRSKDVANRLKLKAYTLRDYVVQRDMDGRLIELITRDTTVVGALPHAQQMLYKTQNPTAKDTDKVSLYYSCKYDGSGKGLWKCQQYVEDMALGNPDQYELKDFPYTVLTWELASNRHYGTGLMEEYAGDWNAFTVLNEAFLRGLAEMCRIVHLADPAGDTDTTQYEQAQTGDVLPGRVNDISTPDLGGKNRDYGTVASAVAKIERNLGDAFLYANSAVRDAERVTAEEIRMIRSELEAAFGGIYSVLATDLQAWLADSIMSELELPFAKNVTTVVVTGVDAMSANADLENLQLLLADLAAAAQLPEPVMERLDWSGLIETMSAYRQVEYFKFLKSEEQVQQEQTQRQKEAMAAQQQMEAHKQQAGAQGQIAVQQASAELQPQQQG